VRIWTPILWLTVALASAADRPTNWTGRFEGCDRTDEVMTQGPMRLGVRFATSNPALAAEFRRAMDFWAGIVEMEWHEENSRDCVIQVVDGSPGLFKRSVIARAQLPGTPMFRGAIAFNKKIAWSLSDLYITAVHEIGHIMGVPHNPNIASVMYFLSLGGQTCLDAVDLTAAAKHHKLRKHVGSTACATSESPAPSPSPTFENGGGEGWFAGPHAHSWREPVTDGEHARRMTLRAIFPMKLKASGGRQPTSVARMLPIPTPARQGRTMQCGGNGRLL
jgi:hypothetical protein